MGMFIDLGDQALGLKIGQHIFPRLKPLQPLVGLGHIRVKTRLCIQDINHLQIVAAAYFEIVKIMSGRYLHGA